ncbi:MAG: polysaccharide biosynthesis tyrosine autokinase, partial [Anaerolineae bacterium]|nr:polysaccharide biosynthesis tyrosine autokinase [Phycisphaerae bacterium]
MSAPGPGGGALLAGQHAAPLAATGMSAADIWRVLRANALLIIAGLMFSGLLGFGLNWYLARYHSRFTATGYVAVEPRRGTQLITNSGNEYQDYTGLQIEQRTQAGLLKTEALFMSVLQNQNLGIRQTNWFKQFVTLQKGADGLNKEVADIGAAKIDLMDRFEASGITDSKLIKVEMTCPNPSDCKQIVMDVVSTHLDQQRQLTQSKTLDRTQSLTSLKTKYEIRIRELSDKQNNLMLRLQMGSVGNPTARYTTTDLELQSAMSKTIELQANAAAAKGQYETIANQMQQGIDPPTVNEIVERDPTVMSYKDQIVRLDVEIRAASQAGRDSRMIREMQLRRDGFDEELRNLKQEKTVSARNALLSQAQAGAQATQDSVDVATKKIDQLKGVLGDLAIAMSDYLSVLEELTLTRAAAKEVRDQLDTLSASTAQMQVDWAQRPETPILPSFPKLAITLLVTVMLGMGVCLGIAFTREMLDTSVRSPRDIARVGQMNLLGMIPHEDDDPQSAGIPLPTVIFQAPTSIMAEQYRQVRTRLQHAASLDTTRSILITSPGPQDGKTTVACNLAAGLALNGRKILLVDANFRRPELNKIFNVPNDVGFSNALATTDNFEGAIRSSQVPNLDVMTTGPRPANPAELLESQLFSDFIDRALEEYDHVIFDTAPMLLAAESAAMAPRVDGVVSVVKAASNSRGLLQRLRDGLRQLKA